MKRRALFCAPRLLFYASDCCFVALFSTKKTKRDCIPLTLSCSC